MAAREPSRYMARALPRALGSTARPQGIACRRFASDEAPARRLSSQMDELETASSLEGTVSEDVAKSFDPVAQANSRKTQLPRSRYQFRSPKYYRGPLHPHQPPPPSDPSSRVFVPGPFSSPRAQQTYTSTIAQDILALCYVHNPPGFKPPPKAPRLREWDDSPPTIRTGPSVDRVVERITIHSHVKGAIKENSSWLHVAGMAIQTISNVKVTTYKSKTSVPSWGVVPGRDTCAVKAELQGENMYHFLGKLIDVVLPRIKDWPGIKGSSGDSSGNITFGLAPESVAMFPEIEVNYDMYPPKMIPGCHITLHTTAKADKDAQLLLSALGLPFYGKMIN
ncbi:hypothetical protein NUU61_001862 [Penicillium alfredii]|uniref:Large ribosomal subunit protein uL5 C-terminal domain-containing protein n=1 Tax=Penicillium alfredii TaxID=1506179 RepID=A0A9W9FQH6_9EURO|nr:uncharacterized protein NUU61_001862 [Penicillium alfredii]KAJ5104515.1 hypothetical protein NUU61_001862 [Penicillium alfredii]